MITNSSPPRNTPNPFTVVTDEQTARHDLNLTDKNERSIQESATRTPPDFFPRTGPYEPAMEGAGNERDDWNTEAQK
ncbi:hypothetical protein BJ508DRAFT_73085 [Ascobolus immersus RN42]|uniref:Uncharacterized protein n=1 Tax=Ascobolus immersus RN42 TaxID=1160509 RepID=A0A3N4HIN5_ASCIM|nr:hypothetical protein BJ508DRAFT_73085 [Ascobolus immersus RN42]